MGYFLTKHVTKYDIEKGATIDCGIIDDIILQLDERNKGCGIFTDSEYIFKAFDTSKDHLSLYYELGKIIEDDNYHFIVAVYPVDSGEDSRIEVNIFANGKFIRSEFENAIISQIYREADIAESMISRKVVANKDDFMAAQARRERDLLEEATFEEAMREAAKHKKKSFIECLISGARHIAGIA